MADQSASGTEWFKQKPQKKDGLIPLEDQDPNWAWLTLVGFVYLRMASHGVYRCQGLFYLELLDIFNAGPAKTSLVTSLFYVFAAVPGPLFGYLFVRLSGRLVIVLAAVIGTLGFVISGLFVSDIAGFIIAFCILSGIPIGAQFVCSMNTLNKYFVRRQSLVNGICFSGGSFGSIIFPVLFEQFCDKYTFRGTMVLLGGVWLNCAVCGMLLVPVEGAEELSRSVSEAKTEKGPERKSLASIVKTGVLDSSRVRKTYELSAEELRRKSLTVSPSEDNQIAVISFKSLSKLHPNCEGKEVSEETSSVYQNSSSDQHAAQKHLRKVLFSWDFVLYLIFWTFAYTATGTIYILPAYLESVGLTKQDTTVVLATIGSMEIVGRLCLGYLGDKSFMDQRLVISFNFMAIGVATCVLPWTNSFAVFIGYAVLMGLIGNSYFAYASYFTHEAFGPGNVGFGIGFWCMYSGLIPALTYLLFGIITEVTGKHYYNLLLTAGCYILGAVTMTVDRMTLSKRRQK